jgi:hypothetical protein
MRISHPHSMLQPPPEVRRLCAARYFKLWEGQRKGPTSRYQDMDDVAAPAGGARGNRGGRGGAESPAVDEGSKARAEAVVAAALAQVGSQGLG